MSESNQRGLVIRALSEFHAVAVENPALPGTPDINYVEGWIELKELPAWPSNADSSPVLVKHYTPQQRRWQVDRRLDDGQCWFLLKVRNDWLLFDAVVAALNVGLCTRAQLFELAHFHMNRFEPKELVRCILQRQKPCYSIAGDRVRVRQMLLETLRSLSAAT